MGKVSPTTTKVLKKIQQVARFNGLLLVGSSRLSALLHGLLCLDGESFKVYRFA